MRVWKQLSRDSSLGWERGRQLQALQAPLPRSLSPSLPSRPELLPEGLKAGGVSRVRKVLELRLPSGSGALG